MNDETAKFEPASTNSVVVRDSEPIFTTIDNEVVMMSPRQQAYFGLGTVGSEIWNAIEKPRRVSDICVVLQQEFEVNPDVCRREVLAFINDLLERGLARIVSDEAEA